VAEAIGAVAAGGAVPADKRWMLILAVERHTALPAGSTAKNGTGAQFDAHPHGRRQYASMALTRALDLHGESGPLPELNALGAAQKAYSDQWPALCAQLTRLLSR
jgi:hypothetical protein